MHSVLIVDDAPEIRSLIRIHLERSGIQTYEAKSGRQAIEWMREHSVSLILLDIMMDDGNGFEVLQYLRDNGLNPLIIALSAKSEVQVKIDALGLGADDYVTKPFSPLELIARVHAQLRRYHPHSPHKSDMVRLNRLALDVDNLVLHIDGRRHVLTQVECELLKLFMQNPDRVLTKIDIYQHVWKHRNYDNNNLSVFISRIRAVLGDQAVSPRYLQTVRGIGYRFSGDGR